MQLTIVQESRKIQEKAHQIVAFRIFFGIFKIWVSYQHIADKNNYQVLLLICFTIFLEVTNLLHNFIIMFLILQLGSIEEFLAKRSITAFHYVSDLIYHLIIDVSKCQSLILLRNLEMYNNEIKCFGISIRYLSTVLQLLVLYYYSFYKLFILQIYIYFIIFPVGVLIQQSVLYLFWKYDLRQQNKNQKQIKQLIITENDSCSICLLGFTNVLDTIQLPCHQSHIFHSYCFHKWIIANKTCPLCRMVVVIKK